MIKYTRDFENREVNKNHTAVWKPNRTHWVRKFSLGEWL